MFSLYIFTFIVIIHFSTQTFVDLGHDLSEDTPIFPDEELQQFKFKRTVLKNETTPEGFWVAFNSFTTFEHIGTHVDAPYHFNEFGWSLEEIPLQRLISPAAVIDVSSKAALDPNYFISAEDVDDWIAENGLFPNNSVILGRTGWSKKFANPLEYFGTDENFTEMNFPGFGVDAVNHIMDLKNTHNIHTVGFGVDTMSLDYAPGNVLFPAHVAVQAQNQFIIENMNNLEVLPIVGATLFVMPMKIRGGTGAPARIIAQLPPAETPAEFLLPLPSSTEGDPDSAVAVDATLTPSDVGGDSPADVVENSPADVVEDSPADVVEASPSDVVKDSSADVVKDSSADVVEDPPSNVGGDSEKLSSPLSSIFTTTVSSASTSFSTEEVVSN